MANPVEYATWLLEDAENEPAKYEGRELELALAKAYLLLERQCHE